MGHSLHYYCAVNYLGAFFHVMIFPHSRAQPGGITILWNGGNRRQQRSSKTCGSSSPSHL